MMKLGWLVGVVVIIGTVVPPASSAATVIAVRRPVPRRVLVVAPRLAPMVLVRPRRYVAVPRPPRVVVIYRR